MTNSDEQVYHEAVNSTALPDTGTFSKACLTVTSVLVVIFVAISLLALGRTRRTPKVSKFLSCGLIFFDLVGIVSFSVRRFITDPIFAIQAQAFSLVWCFLSNITVALLSLERFFLFQWPFIYLRNINSGTAKLIASGIWCSYFSTYNIVLFSRCGRCFKVTVAVREYTEDAKTFVKVTYPVITLVSFICFSYIFIIICKKKKDSMPGTAVEAYKSTTAVLVCLLNFFMMASLFLVVTLTDTDIHIRWLLSEILMTINGIVDTLIYVLWYRECRLEVVKLLACLFPSLRSRSERMAMSIFNIVTYECRSSKSKKLSNKT